MQLFLVIWITIVMAVACYLHMTKYIIGWWVRFDCAFFCLEFAVVFFRLVVNTGVLLWLQQFCAIFLKRLFNSLRFWSVVILQMIIPVIFVILGLLNGYLATNVGTEDTQDPLRPLTLPDTAPSSNISLFWAQFGSPSSGAFNLQVRCNYASLKQ